MFERTIDLDAALAIAIPKISAATDEDAEAAAIAELLAVFHDPQTRVDVVPPEVRANDGKSPAIDRKGADGSIRTERGVVVVPLIPLSRGETGATVKRVTDAIAKADSVVIDLSAYGDQTAGYGAYALLEGLASALVARDASPAAYRWIQHEGFVPQHGTTSGNYRTYFASEAPKTYHPKKDHHPARVAFVFDKRSWLPDLAAAMRRRGDAILVGRGAVDPRDALLDEQRVRSIPIGPRHVARIRYGESVEGDLPFDIRLDAASKDSDAAVDRAIDALNHWHAPERRKPAPLVEAHEVADLAYADQAFPPLERRVLSAFRLWNAIRLFYPYRALMDSSWDDAFEDAIPAFENATTAVEYAQAVARFSTHVPDSHIWVQSRALRESVGTGVIGAELKRIEGLPVVIRASEIAAKEGLHIGDVLLEMGGESFDARASRIGQLIASSNAWTHARTSDDRALWCTKGTTIAVRVRDVHDAVRSLTMTCNAWAPLDDAHGPAFRKIDDAIGYVDLGRLESRDVNAMFAELDTTRAIVFDMRGYPHGTAWPIARHLNSHGPNTVAARFARVLLGGPSDEGAGDARAQFSQYLPFDSSIKHYAGKTVMLVDERTQSQAEHTGLFFEAANGTTFIGSPSAGANGDITGVILPGDVYVSFTGHDVRHADGRQLQRVGLQPEIVVSPTLKGIREGKDEVLDRALTYLREGFRSSR